MTIRTKTRNIHGLEIGYTDTGPSDGRVLFAVHGLLSNGRDFDALALQLAEQGIRTIAIDLPGRGKSAWLPDKSLYTPPTYIPYCLDLVNHVTGGKPFDWLGVSLGGILGMSLHNLEGLKMERLLLVDIGPEIPAKGLNVVADIAMSPVVYETRDKAVAFLKRRCAAWGITNPEQWEHLISHDIIETQDGTFRLHYDPGIAQPMTRENETMQFWELWEQIKQPLFLLRGETSIILPSDVAQAMEERYHGASMTSATVPDCGHVPNLLDDRNINSIADWLKD